MLTAWQHHSSIHPVRVLRLLLRGPVTLGHALLLWELGSPVISGDPIGFNSLSIAAFVCSGTVKQARKSVESPFRILGMKLWAMTVGGLDPEYEADKFVRWFSSHCSAPTAWRKGQGASKELAAPWPVHLLALAMSELGMSRAESESTSVRELQQLIGAKAEARGESEFKTDKEQRIIDWLKENEVVMPARN